MNFLGVSTLITSSLAKQAGIPSYKSIPKKNLYEKLQESFNLERLQRAESRRKLKDFKVPSASSVVTSSSRKRPRDHPGSKSLEDDLLSAESTQKYAKNARRVKLNTLDPIMQTAILKKNTWKFFRPNGTFQIQIPFSFS